MKISILSFIAFALSASIAAKANTVEDTKVSSKTNTSPVNAYLLDPSFSYTGYPPTSFAKPITEPAIDFWGPYMAKIYRKIRGHWHQPTSYRYETLKVNFDLYKNGSISNIGIESFLPSTNESVKAALQAIKGSAPFPAPPEYLFEKEKQYYKIIIDFSSFSKELNYYSKHIQH